MVELRQLRKFVVLAEQRNFTRAAELLHIAQPALSREIARLEEQLGVRLIDRTSRPLQLTDAGRRFHDDALVVLDRAERMESSVRQTGLGHKRLLTIAFSPTIVYGGLSDVMRRLKNSLPHIEIRWRELTSRDQSDGLRTGAIDIGFTRYRNHDGAIVHIPMRDERLFAAIPESHALAASDAPLKMADLDGGDVIIYPSRSNQNRGFADQTLAWFYAVGSRPGEIQEVSEIDTALALVAAGLGMCLVPASSRHLRPDVRYRLVEDEKVFLPVFMCHRLQEDEQLIESIKAVIREFVADDVASSLDPAYNRYHIF
ncbi:LysR family transcriptional regulator [soil metagenome]